MDKEKQFTFYAIAGCDKPDSCAQATERVDVYDVLVQNWTRAGSDLAFHGRQPNNTNITTSRWGFATAVLNSIVAPTGTAMH